MEQKQEKSPLWFWELPSQPLTIEDWAAELLREHTKRFKLWVARQGTL